MKVGVWENGKVIYVGVIVFDGLFDGLQNI
jgi:hypothetical protein